MPVCLICGEPFSASSMRKPNLKRHYETVHVKTKHNACGLDGQMRKDKIAKLKRVCIANRQSFIYKQKGVEGENIVKTSFALCELIAREMKPFSHGEFIMKALNTTADNLCPEKKCYFQKSVYQGEL